jgi:hypothetical protein
MASMGKVRRTIALKEVPIVFSDDCVRQLAAEAKLPLHDVSRISTAIRHAAESYICDANTADDNVVHHEIRTLYYAARRHRCPESARLIEALSPRTREIIAKRAARPSVPWRLPDASALHDTDETSRLAACHDIMRLLARGGQWRKGRVRPGGDRSMMWDPILIGPTPQRRVRRRAAENSFILKLQLAHLNATGRAPPFTAHYASMGPFIRFARACLRSVAGPAPNAIEIINQLQRRRIRLKILLQLRRAWQELLRLAEAIETLEQLLEKSGRHQTVKDHCHASL